MLYSKKELEDDEISDIGTSISNNYKIIPLLKLIILTLD